MEAMQQRQSPAFQEHPHAGVAALIFGLLFGVVFGIIDAGYFLLIVHTRFSLGEDIPPYLYPQSENAPYFNIHWTFLYNLPMYILLALVFLLVWFLMTSITRKRVVYMATAFWTGSAYLALHCVLATYFLYHEEIEGTLGSLSTGTVARGVLIPALLYSVVAG